jgi:hypothetical protein
MRLPTLVRVKASPFVGTRKTDLIDQYNREMIERNSCHESLPAIVLLLFGRKIKLYFHFAQNNSPLRGCFSGLPRLLAGTSTAQLLLEPAAYGFHQRSRRGLKVHGAYPLVPGFAGRLMQFKGHFVVGLAG